MGSPEIVGGSSKADSQEGVLCNSQDPGSRDGGWSLHLRRPQWSSTHMGTDGQKKGKEKGHSSRRRKGLKQNNFWRRELYMFQRRQPSRPFYDPRIHATGTLEQNRPIDYTPTISFYILKPWTISEFKIKEWIEIKTAYSLKFSNWYKITFPKQTSVSYLVLISPSKEVLWQ